MSEVTITEETITIEKSEYDSLLKDSEFLGCLESAGVDNWEGYYEARKMQRKEDE